MNLFVDRYQAGRVLAPALSHYAARPDVLVLALPRGGVPVGYEVALALDAPLDVFVVRKLGAPGQKELAMGALASGGICVLNDEVVRILGVTTDEIRSATQVEQSELERRERSYRGSRPPVEVAGKTVIVVDDGLATGSTMRAAIQALRKQHPKKIVVAVPVGAPGTCSAMANVADDVVCAATPEPFFAVGTWYQDFSQTSDEEVRALLEAARRSVDESTAFVSAPEP